MKNFVCVAATALVLSAGAAVASPLTGDGTFENNYVVGQQTNGPRADSQSSFHYRFGDGTMENRYVNGQHKNAPLDATPVAATGQRDSGN